MGIRAIRQDAWSWGAWWRRMGKGLGNRGLVRRFMTPSPYRPYPYCLNSLPTTSAHDQRSWKPIHVSRETSESSPLTRAAPRPPQFTKRSRLLTLPVAPTPQPLRTFLFWSVPGTPPVAACDTFFAGQLPIHLAGTSTPLQPMERLTGSTPSPPSTTVHVPDL